MNRGYMIRHKVRPGITGWAQIDGLRGETSTVDKMQRRIQYDLDCLKNWSLTLDLKIIARTALILLQDRNAYLIRDSPTLQHCEERVLEYRSGVQETDSALYED